VPCSSRGYDANKKINGRKRFIVTDTLSLLLVVCVMAAPVQDRDGAKTTLLSVYLLSVYLLSVYLLTLARFVFADAGFAGTLVECAQRVLRTTMHIVRKADRENPRQGG
jgi:hypothetical protein